MGKVPPISDQERDHIVRMRKSGVSVLDISRLTERSTHSIYRLLKKLNGKQQNVTPTSRPNANSCQIQPLEDSLDANSSLLCAVESVEVSAYEPIPMPVTMTEAQPVQRPGTINTSVPTPTSTGEPRGTDNVEFWLMKDATAPVSTSNTAADFADKTSKHKRIQSVQLQPSKKQKTSTSQALRRPADTQISTELGAVEVTVDTITQVETEPPLQEQPSKQQSSLTSRDNEATYQPLTPMTLELAVTPTTRSTNSSFRELLQRIQDEIRRLESLAQCDIYDAQLMHMLVKFHAEVVLVQIQKAQQNAQCNVSPSKQLTQEGSGDEQTNRLLREKLAKEVAILDIQAERERLELKREQIKHKMTTLVWRKRLLNAKSSPEDVDAMLSHQ